MLVHFANNTTTRETPTLKHLIIIPGSKHNTDTRLGCRTVSRVSRDLQGATVFKGHKECKRGARGLHGATMFTRVTRILKWATGGSQGAQTIYMGRQGVIRGWGDEGSQGGAHAPCGKTVLRLLAAAARELHLLSRARTRSGQNP